MIVVDTGVLAAAIHSPTDSLASLLIGGDPRGRSRFHASCMAFLDDETEPLVVPATVVRRRW